MARRFSPIQKAVLETFDAWQKERPDEFNRLFRELRAPLYFASEFGEIASLVREARDILARNLPVSPLAFQHSVQNCAAGYFSIVHALHNPSLSISSGFLAFDKAMFWAWQGVSTGRFSAVCVAVGRESTLLDDTQSSTCELIVVSNPAAFVADGACFSLDEFALVPSLSAAGGLLGDDPDCSVATLVEGPTPAGVAELRLDESAPRVSRLVSNREGETVVSRWRRIS
jgi:hypothetical protein